MNTLLKLSLAALVLIAGKTGATDPPTLALPHASDTAIALSALRSDIRAELRANARHQLHEVLPAAFAAIRILPDNAVATHAAPAQSPLEPGRRGIRMLGGSSGSEGDRGGLRWQSLLPGMMK